MPARIQGDQREGVGWPEFTGRILMAAAGVRAESGAVLVCTGGLVDGCARLLGAF